MIWGDKLFITTAISSDDKLGLKTGIYGDIAPVQDTSVHEWKVYCLDKKTGKIIWEKTSFVGVPTIKRHSKSSHANTSVATDGNFVVAFFGSEGLYCYDMAGNLIWKKDFGKLESVFFAAKSAEWEFASSPIIHKGCSCCSGRCYDQLFRMPPSMLKQVSSSGKQSVMSGPDGRRPISTTITGRISSSLMATNIVVLTTSRQARRSGGWQAAAIFRYPHLS